MKRTLIKRILSLLLIYVLFSLIFVTSVNAVTAEPYLNNALNATTSASISNSGVIKISNSYNASKAKFSKAVITTYIEKKTLGLFWKRVDIGRTDNQWVDTSTNYTYLGSHSFQLKSTGTYRVTVTFVISGSGGSPDTITKVLEKKY